MGNIYVSNIKIYYSFKEKKGEVLHLYSVTDNPCFVSSSMYKNETSAISRCVRSISDSMLDNQGFRDPHIFTHSQNI